MKQSQSQAWILDEDSSHLNPVETTEVVQFPVLEPAYFVAESPAMQEVFRNASIFGPTDDPVLVQGESGSGRESVARVLHEHSGRRRRPFVPVSVSELAEQLLFSEPRSCALEEPDPWSMDLTSTMRRLFEEVRGGTLYLDGLEEMPMPLQLVLLRYLGDGHGHPAGNTQTHSRTVRIVCAAGSSLQEALEKGTLRKELFYRLKVLSLKVAPLRERKEDILPLARCFLPRFTPAKLGLSAETLLLAYEWPGNVRELLSALRHAALLAQADSIEHEHLPREIVEAASQRPRLRTLAEVEMEHIKFVVDACRGCQVEAARVLGIGRTTLWRKLRGENSEP